MKEFIQTLIISCIPAAITCTATVIAARIQIKSLKDQNRHDIEKLMKQHEIDIDNLKEKHALEMAAKDKEHQYQLEILQKEYDNKLLLLQKEIENAQTIEGIKGVFGMINSTLQTPQGQKLIGDSFKKAKDEKE